MEYTTMSVDWQIVKLKALVTAGNHSELEIKDIWDQWLVGKYMRCGGHALRRSGVLSYLHTQLSLAGFPKQSLNVRDFPIHTLDGSHTFAYNAWRV